MKSGSCGGSSPRRTPSRMARAIAVIIRPTTAYIFHQEGAFLPFVAGHQRPQPVIIAVQ